ncbi:MAG: hypothetical protein R3A48_20550 [Polyangiales bacterium]
MSLRGAGLALLALLACTATSPEGAPCTTAARCASGLCLRSPSGEGRCVARCDDSTQCPQGTLCGRFDLRGLDEAGVPAGDLQDVVRVCRPPLNAPCQGGCGAGEGCFGGVEGVCSPGCDRAADCGGRDCVELSCGERRCAPPCDAIAECPAGYLCDVRALDARGHGQCLPIAGSDAGAGCPDAP